MHSCQKVTLILTEDRARSVDNKTVGFDLGAFRPLTVRCWEEH